MTSFYYKCLYMDVTGKDKIFKVEGLVNVKDFCQKHLKKEWSIMPLKELSIFFPKGSQGNAAPLF